MPQSFIHLVAILLMPCLLAEPVRAMGGVEGDGAHRGAPFHVLWNDQALAVRFVTAHRVLGRPLAGLTIGAIALSTAKRPSGGADLEEAVYNPVRQALRLALCYWVGVAFINEILDLLIELPKPTKEAVEGVLRDWNIVLDPNRSHGALQIAQALEMIKMAAQKPHSRERVQKDFLGWDITRLHLKKRTRNALLNARLVTLRELYDYSAETLLHIDRLGPDGRDDVIAALHEQGLPPLPTAKELSALSPEQIRKRTIHFLWEGHQRFGLTVRSAFSLAWEMGYHRVEQLADLSESDLNRVFGQHAAEVREKLSYAGLSKGGMGGIQESITSGIAASAEIVFDIVPPAIRNAMPFKFGGMRHGLFIENPEKGPLPTIPPEATTPQAPTVWRWSADKVVAQDPPSRLWLKDMLKKYEYKLLNKMDRRPVAGAAVPIQAFNIGRVTDLETSLKEVEIPTASFATLPELGFVVSVPLNELILMEPFVGTSAALFSGDHHDCLAVDFCGWRDGRRVVGHAHLHSPGEITKQRDDVLLQLRWLFRQLAPEGSLGLSNAQMTLSIQNRWFGFSSWADLAPEERMERLRQEAQTAGVSLGYAEVRPKPIALDTLTTVTDVVFGHFLPYRESVYEGFSWTLPSRANGSDHRRLPPLLRAA